MVDVEVNIAQIIWERFWQLLSWPQGREQQRILQECMRMGAEEDRKFREGRLGRRSREWDIGEGILRSKWLVREHRGGESGGTGRGETECKRCYKYKRTRRGRSQKVKSRLKWRRGIGREDWGIIGEGGVVGSGESRAKLIGRNGNENGFYKFNRRSKWKRIL